MLLHNFTKNQPLTKYFQKTTSTSKSPKIFEQLPLPHSKHNNPQNNHPLPYPPPLQKRNSRRQPPATQHIAHDIRPRHTFLLFACYVLVLAYRRHLASRRAIPAPFRPGSGGYRSSRTPWTVPWAWSWRRGRCPGAGAPRTPAKWSWLRFRGAPTYFWCAFRSGGRGERPVGWLII